MAGGKITVALNGGQCNISRPISSISSMKVGVNYECKAVPSSVELAKCVANSVAVPLAVKKSGQGASGS
jgi:hypothetical protein